MAAGSIPYKNGAHTPHHENEAEKQLHWLLAVLGKAWPAAITLFVGLYAGGWIIGPAKETAVKSLDDKVASLVKDVGELRNSSLNVTSTLYELKSDLRVLATKLDDNLPDAPPKQISAPVIRHGVKKKTPCQTIFCR
jgi:hypothetical protein